MQKNPLYNTSSISFFQYLFAIAVILVHSGRLTSYEPLHFGLKSMLGRLAVPFFIVCASFFLKQSLGNSQKMKAYLVKIVKTYLFWSFVYLPYAWLFFSSLRLPVYLFPAGVLIALIYLGMCYQLWYIPAFLLGLFLVNQLVKHLGMVWTGLITLLLYCWGLIETYSAYLDTTSLLKGYQLYSNLFFTARNGLFYTPIFIYMGYYLYDHFHAQAFSIHRWQKLALAFGLLCLEGIIIFQHEGIDKNFFFLLPFVTVYFVNACLRSSFLKSYDLQYLKQMSIALYFSHPIFIEWARYGFSSLPLSYPDRGKLIFVTALFGSHLFGLAMLWLQDKKKNQKTSPI
ncbi:acyltransferase family protein [Streptococcus parasanguinis]|uniref:acyltransferase family protein n=1 Tax=Streptococcus parasanguinis TaxID=1318 RepID=UPI0012BCD213|nr:acyltransferase family protein [Streptococcus parasanguinis]MTR99347.1 acyltransferase [Streptococcus parasanguinis]MTS11002.1 acyltransferase [Streptococcus parasanguinis]